MLEPNSQFQPFTLQDVDGASVSSERLVSQGEFLFVFFKIVCPVCQFTFPFLERISMGSGRSIVGISQDDRQATAEFIKRYGLTFPILLDLKATKYAVSKAFEITNVPSLFLIGVDGGVVWSDSGFSKKTLEELGRRWNSGVFRPGESVPEFKPG